MVPNHNKGNKLDLQPATRPVSISKSRPLTSCSMELYRITINSKAWCAITVQFSSWEKRSSATRVRWYLVTTIWEGKKQNKTLLYWVLVWSSYTFPEVPVYGEWHSSFWNPGACLAEPVTAWGLVLGSFPWGPGYRDKTPFVKPGICLGELVMVWGQGLWEGLHQIVRP